VTFVKMTYTSAKPIVVPPMLTARSMANERRYVVCDFIREPRMTQ
jgi:hypothetical protein